MKIISQRKRPERVEPAHLDRALAKFRQYKAAGRHKAISEVLAKYAISSATLNSWLQNPERARSATKAPYLLLAAKDLPTLTDEKKHQAYALLLQELGIKGDHAEQLSSLAGLYTLKVAADIEDIQFQGEMTIDARSGVVAFWARYETRGHYRKFDGLVVQRNNLIHLFGLSEHNMFIANLEPVRDSSKEIMYGTFAYEESGGVGYVRFALVPRGHKISELESNFIKKQLSRPIV